MNRAIKIRITLILIFAWSFAALAQQPIWKRSVVKDIESGRPAEKFVLVGTFIELPSGLTQQDVPSLIIVCSEGRLVRQYGLVRAILWNGGTKADTVIDGGKPRTVSLDVMATRDKAMTDDEAHRTFSTFDIQPLLIDLLRAKTAKMALRDDYGSSYRGDSPRQTYLEFKIPNSSDLVSACGLRL